MISLTGILNFRVILTALRRSNEPKKPIYPIIDTPTDPLVPFVLATCNEPMIDKNSSRFAEVVTRQLFGDQRMHLSAVRVEFATLTRQTQIQPRYRTDKPNQRSMQKTSCWLVRIRSRRAKGRVQQSPTRSSARVSTASAASHRNGSLARDG